MNNSVAIARILKYESTLLERSVALVLEESGFRPGHGERVLVKPNLVAGTNAEACTSNPLVIRAACIYILDHGAEVMVADSPAFGPASYVARASGLTKAVGELGLKVHTLKRATDLKLTGGGTIGLSRDAMEAESILNVPKLKVHCQMTMSASVKNMFGCVVGFRKALAHNRLGHSHDVFRTMLMDVYQALPQTHHLMDAVHPLHKNGPIKGEPFELGMLAAAGNGIALDTAAYAILGLTPSQVPLWDEAVQRSLPGCAPADLDYPLEQPELFDADGFVMSPERDLSFAPSRLIKGRLRSLVKYFKK